MKDKEKKITKHQIINILILILIISGILGFIYEEIFYKIDLGYFVKRGSTFGPWIPIYAFGGVLLTIITHKWKEDLLKVFLISLFVTGILEYGTGYVLFEFFHTRLWNYNTEILNFGNINGYICLRSVLLFAIAGVFLNVVLIPWLTKIVPKKEKLMNILCPILLGAFTLDVILHLILKGI